MPSSSFLTPPNLDPAAGQLTRLRIRAVNNSAPKTTINQASFGMQRELAAGMVATADFIYTRGSNMASLVNLNQPLPNAVGNNALGAVPYPNFGFIEWRAQNGKSEYKGIDTGLEKRFSKGYAFGVAYTLGNSKTTPRAVDDAGVERLPAGRATSPTGTARATTTSSIGSARLVVNLPLGQNVIARAGSTRVFTPGGPVARSPSTRATTTSAPT
jgi:hypothetical protein